MSVLKVANVHLETTGTNRIDYHSNGFTRIVSGGTGGIVINTGGTEKINVGTNVVISSNVGIGTSSPTSNLHVIGNVNVSSNIRIGGFISFDNNDFVRINEPAANTLVFNTSSTERVRIDASGNVGIGTSSPTTKLNLFGSASGGITTLTDNTSIVIDMTSNNNFAITLGGSNTFINPTTMNPGQSGVIWISQDSGGSRAPSWGSYWRFPSNTAPTLSTAANSVDAIVYVVRNSTSITAQAILNVG